jgi:phosphoribosylaminoimidazolecarboxamide formyltransferase / IMP cyclohydrolase
MQRALLSVWDKTGLIDLARSLRERNVELIASGGTAAALVQAGLPVRTVEEVTGFPEMIGGRVKTLHPAIHAGILARRTPEHLAELAAQNLSTFDLVVVNLYPFQATVARTETTLEEAIEQIDIGGVALVRAAAKNLESVTVLCDPADYAAAAEEIHKTGDTTPATRARLALKAFRLTAAYDAAIAQYLTRQMEHAVFPETLTLTLEKAEDLRYGENPHQHAALYRVYGHPGLADAHQLHGKALSYTNWLDVDGAWRAASDFEAPTAVIVKHTTPSGVASAETLARAYLDACACDPASAFGGVVALNRPMDVETARAIARLFTEVVIAPSFENAALEILQAKKDLRLLEFAAPRSTSLELRSIAGSYLAQEQDREDAAEWRVVSQRAPTAEEERALRFAWRAEKFVKSNAIVLARETKTVGIGAGQMSRVDSVKLAVDKAGERARGAVLASDAFFPFPDAVEAACRAGVTAIAHPGGSLRDAESIQMADQFGAAMVFTGTRHFRH